MNLEYPQYNTEQFYPVSAAVGNFKFFEFESASQLLDAFERSEVKGKHTHSFYSIFWITKGWCSQEIDCVEYRASQGELLIISPSQIHINEITHSDDLKGGIMLFTREFLAHVSSHSNFTAELLLLTITANSSLVSLSKDDIYSTSSAIGAIKAEYNHPEVREYILATLFGAFISQIERASYTKLESQTSNLAIEVYKKFIIMVEANFKQNLSVEEYASSLAMSSKHLNRIIKKITGISTSEVIQRRKLLEAQRLLTYSTMTIQQIADELNYTDSSYFNRLYKRAFGVNPNTYRNSLS